MAGRKIFPKPLSGFKAAEIFLPPIFLPAIHPPLPRETPPEIKKAREGHSFSSHLLRLPKLSRCRHSNQPGNEVGVKNLTNAPPLSSLLPRGSEPESSPEAPSSRFLAVPAAPPTRGPTWMHCG
jgi:hypothetical protein